MFKKIYLIGCVAVVIFNVILRIKTRIENSSPFMKNNYKKIGYRRNILGNYIPDEEYRFGIDLFASIFSIIILYPLLSRIYFIIIIIGKLIGKKVEKDLPKSRLERFKELNYKIKYTVLSKEEMESALNEMGLNEFDKLRKESDEIDNIEENELEVEHEDTEFDDYNTNNEYMLRDIDDGYSRTSENMYLYPSKKTYTINYHDFAGDSTYDIESIYEYKIQGTNVFSRCLEKKHSEEHWYFPERTGCEFIKNNIPMKGNIMEFVNKTEKRRKENHETYGKDEDRDPVKIAEKKINDCQNECEWHKQWNMLINNFILSKEMDKDEFQSYLRGMIDKIKYLRELIKTFLDGTGATFEYDEDCKYLRIYAFNGDKHVPEIEDVKKYVNDRGGDLDLRDADIKDYEKFLDDNNKNE